MFAIIFVMTLIITLTALTALQLLFQGQGPQTTLTSTIQKPYVKCLSEAQPCNTNVDCILCTDKGSYQFICQKPVSNKKGQSYCLPMKPRAPCNEKLGGVWTWSGWNDRAQGWNCVCAYPEIADTPGCKKLNPNVCVKGQYNLDATKRPPRPSDCKCPLNSTLIISKSQVPLCIPRDTGLCSSDQVCKQAYESSELLRSSSEP